MINSFKKILFIVIIATVVCNVINGTNVNGGIYINTSWTLANSPYIVTDTVVVFPGVTLTIQPGVIVKFDDNKEIEIRQAKLIAIGTNIDSITFTSNSFSPTVGIYSGIYLNGGIYSSSFNYCNFKYASIAIKSTVSDTLMVNHSNFKQNSTGLQFIGNSVSQVALINNSNFNYNSKGLVLEDLSYATINYCNFSSDTIVGLILGNPLSPSQIFSSTTNNCNFSNNGTGLLMDIQTSTLNNCHFSNNTTGLQGGTGQVNYVHVYDNSVNNCICDFNQTGLNVDHILIDHCTIVQNQTGYTSGGVNRIKNCTIDSNSVLGLWTYNDSIINCNIKYNGAGIAANSFTEIIGNNIEFNVGANIGCGSGITNITGNTIGNSVFGIDNTSAGTLVITKNNIENNNVGIYLSSSNSTVSCNRICNNTTYDLKYLASSNITASHNYWCTTDSSIIETLIYDGYDNINYGLVNFMPLDTIQCYTYTGISTNEEQTFYFNVFPNPASDYLKVTLPANFSNGGIKIFNLLGELEYAATTTSVNTDIGVSALTNGIYIIQIAVGDNVGRRKFVKQ